MPMLGRNVYSVHDAIPLRQCLQCARSTVWYGMVQPTHVPQWNGIALHANWPQLYHVHVFHTASLVAVHAEAWNSPVLPFAHVSHFRSEVGVGAATWYAAPCWHTLTLAQCVVDTASLHDVFAYLVDAQGLRGNTGTP